MRSSPNTQTAHTTNIKVEKPEIRIQVQVNFQADEPALGPRPFNRKGKRYGDQGRPHEDHAGGPAAFPIRLALSAVAKRD